MAARRAGAAGRAQPADPDRPPAFGADAAAARGRFPPPARAGRGTAPARSARRGAQARRRPAHPLAADRPGQRRCRPAEAALSGGRRHREARAGGRGAAWRPVRGSHRPQRAAARLRRPGTRLAAGARGAAAAGAAPLRRRRDGAVRSTAADGTVAAQVGRDPPGRSHRRLSVRPRGGHGGADPREGGAEDLRQLLLRRPRIGRLPAVAAPGLPSRGRSGAARRRGPLAARGAGGDRGADRRAGRGGGDFR